MRMALGTAIHVNPPHWPRSKTAEPPATVPRIGNVQRSAHGPISTQANREFAASADVLLQAPTVQRPFLVESEASWAVQAALQDVLPQWPQTAAALASVVSVVQPLFPLQQRSMAWQDGNAVEMVASANYVNVNFRMIFLILDTLEAKLDSGI